MGEHNKGQVAASAAEVYEQFFVPALFAAWPEHILQAAGVEVGQTVLDVACGTGILSRGARQVVGASGTVVGVDINDGMLAVARSKRPDIEWRQGEAESLPFEEGVFDHVVSQFGLMFFQDRSKAISEMLRVMKPGQKGCVAVWAALSETPGYAAVAKMLADVFDPDVAKSVEAPYCLSDTNDLESIFTIAGARSISISTISGKARFESMDSWLYTDIKGWTLADIVDDDDYERLQKAAPAYLGRFAGEDGEIEFEAPANLVTFST